MTPESHPRRSRRDFLRDGTRVAAIAGLGAFVGVIASRSTAKGTVWQIDPQKCLHCERCATHCVLEQSAVRCMHTHALCGYCQLCTGYFDPESLELSTAAENQLCPTAAIKRTFVEDPYYEYTIEQQLCIGCARCVEGCNRFGNGSLFLQVSHKHCVNCNECAIAKGCPGDAFVRLPSDRPYLLKANTH
jgi:electron transport complex protein RnfB